MKISWWSRSGDGNHVVPLEGRFPGGPVWETVVLIMGHLRPQYVFSHTPRKSPAALLGMVGLAIAMPPPSVHELRLESDMFVTRLNFDFRIAHCEPK
ncbi:hypothetical protein HAZT_HAZT009061 [Hyalella azteca]|uniref:Uncharacterized protein n=1 Tax=Hyalella azteca TaxID=294128 RepID=A0A6A0GXT0_HYAAZ|nr:hypothetical protein HAZT_HAZT009061 [Hyalella azteca]